MNERNQQLDALLNELRRTKRVRRARGAAVVTGALALTLSFVLWPAGPGVYTPAPTPGPQIANNDPTPVDPPTPTVRPPTIIAVSNTVAPRSVERISDDTLLELLNTNGRRTGLIKRGDEVILDANWLSDADTTQDDRGV